MACSGSHISSAKVEALESYFFCSQFHPSLLGDQPLGPFLHLKLPVPPQVVEKDPICAAVFMAAAVPVTPGLKSSPLRAAAAASPVGVSLIRCRSKTFLMWWGEQEASAELRRDCGPAPLPG